MSRKKASEKFPSSFALQMKIESALRNPPEKGFIPLFNWLDVDELVELILGRKNEQFIILAKTPVYDEFTYGRAGKLYEEISRILQQLAADAGDTAGTEGGQEASERVEAIDGLLHELMHYCVKGGFRAGCRLGRTFDLGEFINIDDA